MVLERPAPPHVRLYVAEPSSVPGIGASPPSWMCAAILADKDVPHRIVELSFERGEHKGPELIALNPRGTIPVLACEDAVVHETYAILLFLESLAPGHLPDERSARAKALTRFFEAEHVKSVGMKSLAYVMQTEGGDRDPTRVAEHLRELRTELERWERYLAADEYVAGAEPSLADFVIHPYVATFVRLGLSLAELPRLADHHRRMAARPSFAVTRPSGFCVAPSRLPFAT